MDFSPLKWRLLRNHGIAKPVDTDSNEYLQLNEEDAYIRAQLLLQYWPWSATDLVRFWIRISTYRGSLEQALVDSIVTSTKTHAACYISPQEYLSRLRSAPEQLLSIKPDKSSKDEYLLFEMQMSNPEELFRPNNKLAPECVVIKFAPIASRTTVCLITTPTKRSGGANSNVAK
jgi:hypothetical protein